MSPADIEAAGQVIYGDNWRAAMAEHLGIDPSLLWRYMTLKTPVPKGFAVALVALGRLKDAGMVLPSVEPVSGPLEAIARAYKKRPNNPPEVIAERIKARRAKADPR